MPPIMVSAALKCGLWKVCLEGGDRTELSSVLTSGVYTRSTASNEKGGGQGLQALDPPVKLLATFIFGSMEEFRYHF